MSDDFLDGRIKLLQKLYKATSDAVLLSSFVPIKDQDTVLDVGIGTGAVSMCLMARNPTILITGIDNCQDALDEAKENADLNQFNIELSYMDIMGKDTLKGRLFDHVVSNPPFFSEPSFDQKEYKKNAHHIQISLDKWVLYLMKKIKPKGSLTLIIRPCDLGIVLPLLEKKLGYIQINPIYSKVNESAIRIIIQGFLGRKTKTQINRPIIVHQADGSYTKEVDDILRGRNF